MQTHPWKVVSRGLALAIALATAAPASSVGQAATPSDGDPSSFPATGMPGPTEGSTAIRFSIVGPLEPTDEQLRLRTAERGCGLFGRQPGEVAHVVESSRDVSVRVDALIGPHGLTCRARSPIRITVALDAPLGDRAILDAAADPPSVPPVNEVDPIDTGLDYTCGGRPGYPVADILGPGIDVSAHGPAGVDPTLRAIADQGDLITFLAPLPRKGRPRIETWGFWDGRWQEASRGTCQLLAVVPPGWEPVTWRLRGRRPAPGARRIKVWAQGYACASGRSVAGRLSRPIIQVRDDAIVIILSAERRQGAQDCQGVPAAPFVVRLPVPLGDRTLYDGGVFPPKEHPARR